jgi:hypothetical protein
LSGTAATGRNIDLVSRAFVGCRIPCFFNFIAPLNTPGFYLAITLRILLTFFSARFVLSGLDTNDPMVDEEAVVEEDVTLPEICPPYISDWGWEQLQWYFSQEGVFYDPSWLAAHFKPTGYSKRWDEWYEGVAPLRKQHMRVSRQSHTSLSKVDVFKTSFSSSPPPPCPDWYSKMNDVVILNQVLI